MTKSKKPSDDVKTHVDSNGFTRRTFVRGALSASIAAPLLANSAFVQSANAMDFSGKTMKLMINQPHVGSVDPLSAAFAELTGAKIEAVAVPFDQLRAQAALDFVSGANEFDVYHYFYIDLGSLVNDGAVVDITDRIEANESDIDPSDFIGAIYDTYTQINGKRYGLPYDGDTHVLFYNTEILERNGQQPPKTWEEFQAVSEAITAAEGKDGVYGCLVMAQQIPLLICSMYANRLGGFGGNFLDANGKPALNTPEALGAAKALLDISPSATPTLLETGFGNSIPLFLNGKAGMMEFWTDMGAWAADPSQSNIVGKWGVVPMPTGGTNTVNRPAMNAGLGFAMASGTKNPDMAWEFIKMASSAKIHLDVLTNPRTGVDPMRRSALPVYKEFLPAQGAVVEKAVEDAFPWPSLAETPKLMQSLTDELGLMLAGDKTVEQAMGDAQASWEKILG